MREHLLVWPPLHYMLANAATSVMTADPELMARYAGMVEDSELHNTFLGETRTEYELSRKMLEELYEGSLEGRRADLAKALELRRKPLLALHHHQVSLLREWRQRPESEDHLTLI